MITVTITTALAVIGCATIAFQARALDKKDAKIYSLHKSIKNLYDKNKELEAELREVDGLNAVQSVTITTLRDRNAILRDALEAVPGPVATVLDIASRLGHSVGRFL